MSTFSGFFDEIPNIVADCFEEENLQAKLFFLSHCHTDHMKGLSPRTCLPGPIYCSSITEVILKKQFPNITDIRVLEIETSIELEFPDEDGNLQKLVVTTLPAQHCPGSVMFLFETHTSTILYTGDFRLSKQDFKKLNFLADKEIDTVYLDSTFLNKNYLHFPHQLESVNAVIKLAEEWLELHANHKVVIETAAHYGYEYLFIELSRKLKCRTHVDEGKWLKYIYIPSMDNCISRDKSQCRIFTVMKSKKLRCDKNVRIITPTAYYWSSWEEGNPVFLQTDEQSFRVAFSNHSSLTEIKEFLKVIRPKEVKLNVVPTDDENRRKMQILLRDLLRSTRAEPNSTNQAYGPVTFSNAETIFNIPKIVPDQPEDDNPETGRYVALPKRKKRPV